MEAHLICKSPAMQAALEKVKHVAPTNVSVLFVGETGVGKTLLARYIHELSGRKDGPFIDVDAGAIPPPLIESELFGHEKGAFTSAITQKIGLIERANGGTLFIDEVQNLSLELQVKFLKVLDSGSFRRVGGGQEMHSCFRLVSATNGNLPELIVTGSFRKDLHFRIAQATIFIPPLRERQEDILPLADFYLQACCRDLQKQLRFSEEVKSLLRNYPWPGNVRELINEIYQAGAFCSGPELQPKGFAFETQREALEHNGKNEGFSLKEMERRYIAMILQKTNGNLAKASDILKVAYSTLARKVQKYGLEELVQNERMG